MRFSCALLILLYRIFGRISSAMSTSWCSQVSAIPAYEFLLKIVHCCDDTKRFTGFVYDVYKVFEQKEI